MKRMWWNNEIWLKKFHLLRFNCLELGKQIKKKIIKKKGKTSAIIFIVMVHTNTELNSRENKKTTKEKSINSKF